MQILKWGVDGFDGVLVNKMHELDGVKEIRISMQAGSQMKEHSAPGKIMVQVLSGEIDFSVGDEIFRLCVFDMISLEPNVSHSLHALKDSVIRLSLSKNDNVNRVFGVLNS
ncbi:cupin domain-containing protein [Campylobacter sp. 19-13652]|uniref:cupin domain-containing protein n=1 Tax=Campylobacter sp. 19-13652 TaxID=2840180 RepID=UPI001C76618E|nr:cupin domain-containing protein [Campylobacter sp. 19-13652]BCX79375.1 hypothetical protein LBC_08370 [Campylobacter sp. 19-13652]